MKSCNQNFFASNEHHLQKIFFVAILNGAPGLVKKIFCDFGKNDLQLHGARLHDHDYAQIHHFADALLIRLKGVFVMIKIINLKLFKKPRRFLAYVYKSRIKTYTLSATVTDG